MISHQWHDEVPGHLAGELEGLIADAADYDAEAGFSTARPALGPPDGATTHHLLVSMPPKGARGSADLDSLPDVRVVASLRLDVADGVGDLQLVVRREFRSLGVATLLFENLRDEPAGWKALPELEWVTGWSHGSHPAAERLSRRFGAGEARTLLKTLCLLGGRTPFAAPDRLARPVSDPITDLPEAAPGHVAAMAPADRAACERLDRSLQLEGGGRALVGPPVEDEPSTAALIVLDQGVDKDHVATLLASALVDLQERGARLVQLYVDAGDEAVLHASRELGFFHDQSDRLYVHDLSS
jgi:mycothiol synthase